MSATIAAPPSDGLRRVWLYGTIAGTVAAFVVAIAMAPPASAPPAAGLSFLLFVGSSVHVAATGWFYAVPEIRGHIRAHPTRYVRVPIALTVGTAIVAAVLPPSRLAWLLLGYFAWQFFHFQKQNLGMAALAGIAHQSGPPNRVERRALVAAGVCGIAGLCVHPELLQLHVDPRLRVLFPLAGVAFLAAVAVGVVAMLRRPPPRRPAAYVVVYLISLLFFAPVFVFRSPYAAVAGLTLAHGLQYLLIVGLIAARRSVTGAASGLSTTAARTVSLAVLLNVALIGGIALNLASHLHDSAPAVRALYGAYLGAVMAHFVIDAGLWRLRDEFPRAFLRDSLPYLLARPPAIRRD
ncbi:MAG TPA: hypothetical protein VKB59_01595 [Micromonosporaceae bacterium]|nr:hypothetical protein [Micromonosporaceae bacterium]